LALDMRTVWGDGVGHGWLRQGLERHGLRRPPRFPHRIQALPRPLEQAATPREGAPVQRGTEPVGGGLALLPEAGRLQEPGAWLLGVAPAAYGGA
jgi:hypothetical protein